MISLRSLCPGALIVAAAGTLPAENASARRLQEQCHGIETCNVLRECYERVDNESPKGFDFDWQCKLMKCMAYCLKREEWCGLLQCRDLLGLGLDHASTGYPGQLVAVEAVQRSRCKGHHG